MNTQEGKGKCFNLTGADLTGADLTGANLTKANLTKAYLREADLTEADLTGADLREAYLTEANLTRANLTGANLSGAKGILFMSGFDKRGWVLICWQKKMSELWFNAGCRSFEKTSALAHWGSEDYPSARGHLYIKAIEFLSSLYQEKIND